MVGGSSIVLLDRGLVDPNTLSSNYFANLVKVKEADIEMADGRNKKKTKIRISLHKEQGWLFALMDQRTLCLKVLRSSGVSVSALATTGMRFTRVPSRFMISMSSGFRLRWVRGKGICDA